MTISEYRRYVKALVMRKMLINGINLGRDLTKTIVTFYGEGNPHPLGYT
jgi:hypothetical protein